jgi:hypothetical protein
MPSVRAEGRFAVVEGGAQRPPPWQDFPQTVVGRSPFDRDEVAYYRLSKSALAKMDVAKRRQPIFDAWTCVLGKVPPVNNSSSLEKHSASRRLLSVSDAHACFRGVRRAVGNDDRGFDVVAFVSRPQWGVCYTPSMSCTVSWFPIPDDLVFVAYVRLDHPALGRYGTRAASGIAVRGVISHWQFVESEAAERDLPVGYKERYRRHLW